LYSSLVTVSLLEEKLDIVFKFFSLKTAFIKIILIYYKMERNWRREELEKLQKPQLQDILRNRDQSTTGYKEQLIKRILGESPPKASRSLSRTVTLMTKPILNQQDLKKLEATSTASGSFEKHSLLKPSVDLLTLESLPLDTQKKVALNLPYETVISFCKVSKKLKRICDDVYFWRDYLKTNIPVNINVPSGASIRWYKDKIEQYPKVKVITDLLDQGKATGEYIQEHNNNWDIFDRVENLQEIYCNDKELTSIPLMPNLQELYCGNNQLTFIPLMANLQILYCENNQLTSIPSMPNLQDLYCTNNQLTSIPLMPNLQDLYCKNNQLTSIPSMPNLRVLWCQDNQLTSIPSMPNLRDLWCDNNQLTSIPSYPNLQVLNCKNNPLPGFTLKYWKKIWKKNKN